MTVSDDQNETRTEPHLSESPGLDQQAEGRGAGQGGAPAAPPDEPPRPRPTSKTDEWKTNLKSVFGQGVGRFSLITAISAIVILTALGVRSITSAQKEVATANDRVQVPSAPTAPVTTDAVSSEEAARRNKVAAEEAAQAAQQGSSYQPAFIPRIDDPAAANPPASTNSIFDQGPQFPSVDMRTTPSPADAAERERKRLEDAQKRRTQAYEAEVKKRDAHVQKQQEIVVKQLDKILQDGALNKLGRNTVATYAVATSANAAPASSGSSTSASTMRASQSVGLGARPAVIRAGNILYAELMSEVNTDKGNDVIATIRGGAWNGSRLIGQVEQRPDNIGIVFTMLAPQDGRNAMRINAVALRTEDVSHGIAEDIDHHTLERYVALAAASILDGFGKAYETAVGTTTIVPSGTTVITTEEPSTRRIVASTVGQLGSSMGQELRRGFNRPPTYSTPANTGIAVFFLADVHAS